MHLGVRPKSRVRKVYVRKSPHVRVGKGPSINTLSLYGSGDGQFAGCLPAWHEARNVYVFVVFFSDGMRKHRKSKSLLLLPAGV